MLRARAAQGRRGWRRSPPTRSSCRFRDAAFDGAMVGWGVRNLVDLDAGLARGGAGAQAGRPAGDPRDGRRRTSRSAPAVSASISGGCCRGSVVWISKHTTAYTWLPESALRVSRAGRAGAARHGARRGSATCRYRLFMGGVCALHVGTRESRETSGHDRHQLMPTDGSRRSAIRALTLALHRGCTPQPRTPHGPRQPPRVHRGHRRLGELVRVTRAGARAPRDRARSPTACMKSPGGGPALLFEHVLLDDGTRSPHPVAINLFGSMRRMCMALGVGRPRRDRRPHHRAARAQGARGTDRQAVDAAQAGRDRRSFRPACKSGQAALPGGRPARRRGRSRPDAVPDHAGRTTAAATSRCRW